MGVSGTGPAHRLGFARASVLPPGRFGGQRRPRSGLEQLQRRSAAAPPGWPATRLVGEDRVAAQLEEVVVDADPLEPSTSRPDPGQHLLHRRARRDVAALAPAARPAPAAPSGPPCRSASAAAPPAPRRPRAPCTRAASPAGAARSSAASRLRRADHVGHQPLSPRLVLARHHHRFAHRRVLPQRRLDLPQLDPEAAHLHLVVEPPEVLELPVRQPAAPVPGPVQPRPRLARERIAARTAPPSAPAGPGSRAPARTPPMYSSPGTPTGTGCRARRARTPACSRSAARSAPSPASRAGTPTT